MSSPFTGRFPSTISERWLSGVMSLNDGKPSHSDQNSSTVFALPIFFR